MLKFYFDRFKKTKRAIIGLSAIIFLILIGIFAPYISQQPPDVQDVYSRLQKPFEKNHILGTDDLGRDIFSRLIYSTRVSFAVGIISVLISVIIGTSLGIISGYYGGKIDILIMRFVDIMLCFPTFFLILMTLAFLEPGITTVMAIIGATSWMGLTRIVRAEVLSLKEREFILAGKLLGLSKTRIFLAHILPNVISPILVSATMGVGEAILIESGLSFLGLGVQPPTPSWGQMISAGKDYIHIAWWLSFFPGVAILLTVLSFNFLSEGLRDILDPRR